MRRQKIRMTTWALAIAFAAISASNVAAQDYCSTPGTTCYSPPAAFVDAASDADLAFDFDVLFSGDLGTLVPRIAQASEVGASAYAESTKNHYAVKALTSGGQTVLGSSRDAHAY